MLDSTAQSQTEAIVNASKLERARLQLRHLFHINWGLDSRQMGVEVSLQCCDVNWLPYWTGHDRDMTVDIVAGTIIELPQLGTFNCAILVAFEDCQRAEAGSKARAEAPMLPWA